jgi:excisionase family DNA binding protein
MTSRLDELFEPYPEHLTVPELAKVLGVRPSTAYRWLQTGIVPGYKVGTTWVILRDEVRDLVASGRNLPGDPQPPPPGSSSS